MPPIKIGTAIVGVKAEGTAYTLDTPVAADAFPAFDITVTPGGDNFQRLETSSHFGKLDSLPGPATMEIAFKVSAMGSGATAPTTQPHWAVSLQAAGFNFVTAGAPVDTHTYSPISVFDGAGGNPALSYSVGAWFDGVRYLAKGCMGNVVMTWAMGAPLELAFTFRGAYVATADAAILVPTGVSTEQPPQLLGAGFAVHAFSAAIESFSIDIGSVLSNVIDANDANGIKGTTIADRRITGTFNPNMEKLADEDFFGDWRSGAIGSLTTGNLGPAVGNQLQLIANRAIYDAPPGVGDRQSIQILDIPFLAAVAAGAADGTDLDLILK